MLYIRTDNGAPFAGVGLLGLSKLSLGWMKLGIVHERIQPGHPQQNGKRMPRAVQKQAMEMTEYGEHGKPKSRLSTLPTPLGNPCGDSHITTVTATTIVYLKTGKGRRKPATRAALAARGL
jgi:hypothetical protein